MYQPLYNHIKRFVDLSADEEEILTSTLKSFSFKKKTFLLEQGQICRSNYFVVKGCIRLFFVNEKGVEQTTQFAIENWWLTDHFAFQNQQISGFYIQAVENTDLIALSLQSQEELFIQFPQMEKYFRLIYQRAYAASQLRMKYQYDFSREELYHHFNDRFPEFIQRIPQYLLASYLGFTPEYLSEIRKKKRS